MTRLNLEIVLPDALAQQAREAGLLEPNAVEEMVRRALLAKRAEKLAEARTVLAANPLPPIRPRRSGPRSTPIAPKSACDSSLTQTLRSPGGCGTGIPVG